MIFQKLISASEQLQRILENTTETKHVHDFPWPALSYGPCAKFRRADLDIIDVREERKLWMLHLVVYPHYNDPAPIYGFDIISGPKKITGAFHDFSPCDPNNLIISQFGENVKDFIPTKKRELPDWAKNIFSPYMIAAGNVRDSEELDDLLNIAINNLKMHIESLGEKTDKDFSANQSWYVFNQRKNPHTPRVMESLGIEKDVVKTYIDKCLWPIEEAWMDKHPLLHD